VPDTSLRWDLADEDHVTRHGVTRHQIEDMIDLEFWVPLQNPSGGPQRRLIVGPTSRGRMLTLVVGLTDTPGDYVPITCWPSTQKEIGVYWRRFR
jgi:hypothetical protein